MAKILLISLLWFQAGRLLAAGLLPGTTNINLAWDPSPSPDVSGYILRYGTASGNYSVSNIYLGNITNATVENLLLGTDFYFVVTAFNAEDVESDFSNEVHYNSALAQGGTNLPPLPPFPSTNGTSSGSGGGGGGTGTASQPLLATNWQTYIAGIPPNLTMSRSNQQVHLKVKGTVGARVQLQKNSILLSPGGWQTLTNVLLTSPDPGALPNNDIPGIINQAFVPASQVVSLPDPSDSALNFYRVVMPCNYPVLADQVLRQKGTNTYLVAVRLPGVDSHEVCHVSLGPGYIDYDTQTYVMRWEPSGSTLREVATKVADTMTLNWTSASQFFHSNGVNVIVSTVVKTDSPANDPAWATVPPPQIVIDF